MTQSVSQEHHHIDDKVADPYKLNSADVMEAPTRLRHRFKFLGPGLITSAMIVGSGELIVTTSLGAQAGFALLWMVIIASTVKVWIQLELAQWTIVTGKPALEGYASIGPRIKGLGTINVAWIIMELCKALQRGGIIGGTAGALSLLVPVIGEPLSNESLAFWAIVTTGAVIAMMISAKYAVVERICVVAIIVLTAITISLAAVLPTTDYAYSAGDILSGLTFAIPVGALGFAVAMFGITGVGSEEITAYTYWCIEKGYARWTGPNDGSEAWKRRAHGWIKVMRLDVLIGWCVSTVCTLSFFLLGAAILHPQNLVPEGNQMLVTLSSIYTSILGEWASTLFLVGAIFVLGSTVIGVAASVPRQWANTLGIMGLIDWKNMSQRKKWIRILTVVIPSLWCISFLVVSEPVIMVLIGGTAAGIFLLAVVIAVWVLRTREVPEEFRSSNVLNGILVICSILIGALAIYSVANTFGFSIG